MSTQKKFLDQSRIVLLPGTGLEEVGWIKHALEGTDLDYTVCNEGEFSVLNIIYQAARQPARIPPATKRRIGYRGGQVLAVLDVASGPLPTKVPALVAVVYRPENGIPSTFTREVARYLYPNRAKLPSIWLSGSVKTLRARLSPRLKLVIVLSDEDNIATVKTCLQATSQVPLFVVTSEKKFATECLALDIKRLKVFAELPEGTEITQGILPYDSLFRHIWQTVGLTFWQRQLWGLLPPGYRITLAPRTLYG